MGSAYYASCWVIVLVLFHQPDFQPQQAAVFSKEALINPPRATYFTLGGRKAQFEDVAAKETNVSPAEWRLNI